MLFLFMCNLICILYLDMKNDDNSIAYWVSAVATTTKHRVGLTYVHIIIAYMYWDDYWNG